MIRFKGKIAAFLPFCFDYFEGPNDKINKGNSYTQNSHDHSDSIVNMNFIFKIICLNESTMTEKK